MCMYYTLGLLIHVQYMCELYTVPKYTIYTARPIADPKWCKYCRDRTEVCYGLVLW